MPAAVPETHLDHSGPRVNLTPGQARLVVCLLGALSVITPLSIDMYLPAFTHIAADLNSVTAKIALSVSTYFVGLAGGQLVYGPILDRFGRKKPLYVGLVIFILTAIACAHAKTIEMLLLFRFLQGFGGCVAQVGAIAMVRDFFPAKESARAFSLLFLFIGVSPLLAPTLGGLLMLVVGWPYIFYVLAALAVVLIVSMFCFLPEGHQPDPGISLRPAPILREFLTILRHPQFITYTFAGTFSVGGLFAFVAGSSIIFMEGFRLSAQAYSGVFALLTFGFIGGSQLNVFLLRRYSSEAIFACAITVQVVTGLLFVIGSIAQWYTLPTVLPFFFTILAAAGLANPNASALALMPFRRNAGSAASLMGFIQLGIGAIISTGIGVLGGNSGLPVIVIFSLTSLLGVITLLLGRPKINAYRARHPDTLADSEHL